MLRVTLAALLLAGATTVAFADSDADKAKLPPGALSADQVTQRLQSQGYSVSKIKFDDGNYKVNAIGPNQQKTKLEVSPSTGTVLKSKVDDGSDD
jgi:hypothetical protein